MASLTAIKLEPKIENGEYNSSNSSSDSRDVEPENQPSCSNSVNASTVTSLSSQLYNYGSDSDESTGDVIDIMSSQPAEQALEVVAIDSDSSEEEEATTIPRKAGLRQLTKRRSFKVSPIECFKISNN